MDLFKMVFDPPVMGRNGDVLIVYCYVLHTLSAVVPCVAPIWVKPVMYLSYITLILAYNMQAGGY